VEVPVLDPQTLPSHLLNLVDLVVDQVENKELLVQEIVQQHHHHKEIQVVEWMVVLVEMVEVEVEPVRQEEQVMDHKVLVVLDLLLRSLLDQQIQQLMPVVVEVVRVVILIDIQLLV
jgi:hypothetical protein